MFPQLSDADIARIRRFGTLRRFARGERLFAAGEPRPGMFVVLKGTVTISQRDGLGHVAPIVSSAVRASFSPKLPHSPAAMPWSTRTPKKTSRRCWCRRNNCAR